MFTERADSSAAVAILVLLARTLKDLKILRGKICVVRQFLHNSPHSQIGPLRSVIPSRAEASTPGTATIQAAAGGVLA